MTEVVSLMDRFNAACAAHPEVPRPKIMVLRHTYVADSDAADAELAAQELNAFYCYFGAWFKNERPISQGLIRADPRKSRPSVLFAEAMRKNQIIGEARGDRAAQGL
jgi:alkanesulfonate monooxygenase SsuD/methylene tetrahydromethanopterin reductase-like flavin-dependent oxidoreductase (luciferase family)